ncbi:hypothetical protein Asi03nite_09150 [Actinoplanes siamensis]|uniref:Uncharacterized protein n=1 Tax=Actinoplanes siamensis TaxID=1223317 RepID=A0A919KDX2_9ACTN|nr:hypothetical protein Asi03nite_09150 [Actinoplanes siamensis]
MAERGAPPPREFSRALLEDPDRVPGRVARAQVGAVEVVGRLLRDTQARGAVSARASRELTGSAYSPPRTRVAST